MLTTPDWVWPMLMGEECEWSYSNSYESSRKLDPSSSSQRGYDICIDGVSPGQEERPGLAWRVGHEAPPLGIAFCVEWPGNLGLGSPGIY